LVDLLIDQGRFDEAGTQLKLLKAQKQEVDKISKSSLNDFQLTLIRITDSEIQAREALLAEKSGQNIIDAIEKSKHKPLSKFLYALGIRHVGEHISEVLARRFPRLDDFLMSRRKN
jgi:DNA ligase (NAD+)